MLVSVVAWLVLALGAGCALGAAQLETGVMALLYYPPAQRAPTSSTQPPRARWRRARRAHRAHRAPRFMRAYFDRDEAGSQDGNDALLQRLRANMTDPDWTPDVGPRSRSALARRDLHSVQRQPLRI